MFIFFKACIFQIKQYILSSYLLNETYLKTYPPAVHNPLSRFYFCNSMYYIILLFFRLVIKLANKIQTHKGRVFTARSPIPGMMPIYSQPLKCLWLND